MLAAFAGLALLLAIVGIYGLISYVTNQRTVEVGLRMAVEPSASTSSFSPQRCLCLGS